MMGKGEQIYCSKRHKDGLASGGVYEKSIGNLLGETDVRI
jgi:hypothetical protein